MPETLVKVTTGFVTQQFDADTGECTGQEFTCSTESVWEREGFIDKAIDEPENGQYQTYEMVQPGQNIFALFMATLTIEVLDGDSQDILDTSTVEIDRLILPANSEGEALEKAERVRRAYVNPFPDSGHPINEAGDIAVSVERVSAMINTGLKSYDSVLKETKKKKEKMDE